MAELRQRSHEQVMKLHEQVLVLQEEKHAITTDAAKAALQYEKRISDLELEIAKQAGANSGKRSRT